MYWLEHGPYLDIDPYTPKLKWERKKWGHGWAVKFDTRILHSHFARLVPGTWLLASVIGLKPGGWIPFHTDDPVRDNHLGNVKSERFHVVLATNPQCWSFHDHTWQQLKQGGIYSMDAFKEHASINLGKTIRYHLVVDVEV